MDKAAFNRMIGQRLRQARNDAGLGQEYVSILLGCERSHVSNLETGRFTLSVWQLVTLAQAYGRSVRDFCTPDPTPEQAALLDELAEATA